jgi:hypothetical protein
MEHLADLTGDCSFRSSKHTARGSVTFRDMPRRRGGIVNGEAVRAFLFARGASLSICVTAAGGL